MTTDTAPAAARRSAAAELIVANDRLRTEVARHATAAQLAGHELADLNDRVGALADELAEAQHDRQVLATENGALREERDALILERDEALLSSQYAEDVARTAEAERARLRRELEAVEARDHEHVRQAMLNADAANVGGV